MPSAVSGADGPGATGGPGVRARRADPVRRSKGRRGRARSCGKGADGEVPAAVTTARD
ncbi:hypothetical protein AB0A94_07800 [Streptomyces sp. NPDC044984]|uniref:hypothetical protein n=1 Tax=Streptomyces sp. NPDC044984 TaxID=3154335 RepID=UPI0033EF2591